MRPIFLILIFLVYSPSLWAETPKPVSPYRGWDYIVEKLLKDGIDHKLIDKIYLSKKMPPVEDVYFKLKPKEATSIYSGFRDKALIKKAAIFLDHHEAVFDAAERVYKVNRYVIAGILMVETCFGQNTGDYLIINRLSRIGSIAKPENIMANFKKHHEEDPNVEIKEVEERANYLENRFYPEVLALFKLAKEQQINLLNLKGSFAGAFGIPQFLPSTFINHAVDGNGDGIISLFDMSDSIFSVANYLMHEGWKDNASQKEKESVIWQYNHSEPYIGTVLYVAGELENNREEYESSK
jgi:membrane-bound lytic murein transglycosylase B